MGRFGSFWVVPRFSNYHSTISNLYKFKIKPMLIEFSVIVQSPGSFLCSFLPSPLSSLSMKMSSLGCLLLSSMLLCLCQLRVSPAVVL